MVIFTLRTSHFVSPIVIIVLGNMFLGSKVVLGASTPGAVRAAKSLTPWPPASSSKWSRLRRESSAIAPEGAKRLLQMKAGATEAEPTSTSKAIFLENNGEWVSCSSTRDTSTGGTDSKLHLEMLSLHQLRQKSKQRGQTSTGSKKQLVERLFHQEPPAPKRPRRRRHVFSKESLPADWVQRQATKRPRPLHPYTPQLRVLSWNVNGIRAQMEKEEGRKALKDIVEQERPHVLGLQEIRISSAVAASAAASSAASSARRSRQSKTSSSSDFTDIIKTILPGYDTFWFSSSPPARQGYSGTALLVRKRRAWDIGCPVLLNIRGGIGHLEGDLEGRVTTAEFDVAYVVNVYTPNAGAGLKRLGFRTLDWDQAFAAYVRSLEKIKPVVVVGDMNVAHEDKDFYNPEEKRMRKAAGTTPEERSSFALNLLGRDSPPSCTHDACAKRPSGGGREFLVDTFRERYPHASGVYSYWSVRAGNRPLNRGMRLDYCLASPELVRGVVAGRSGGVGVLHDAFVLDQDTVGVSDHCPVGVVLRLGEHYLE